MSRTRNLYQLSVHQSRQNIRQMEFVDSFTASHDEDEQVVQITGERFRAGDMVWVLEGDRRKRFMLGSVGQRS